MSPANQKLKARRLLEAGRKLLASDEPVRTHEEFNNWVGQVARWLDNGLDNLALSARWSGLPNSPLVTGDGYHDDPLTWERFRKAVEIRLGWLGQVLTQPSDVRDKKEQRIASIVNKVFVVHGHHGELRESCARLLEKQGLESIILQEKPNRGQTIIEKFESHANVAFAVVLMTKDDEGRKAGDPNIGLTPRARQNVLFELGFFLDRLGRRKVCAIYEPGIELPSDYNGVAYIEYDRRGAWKVDLLRELKTAGLPITDEGFL
jgi:predicted nucleotide-binding protein